MLTAPEVAALCNVDARTVHSWAERGALAVQKTTGGHRRFSPIVVVDFLRKQGYPIARALRERSPEVAVCIASTPVLELARRAIRRRFSLHVYPSLVDALWQHPMDTLEALVLDPSEHAAELALLLPRIAALAPSLRVIHFAQAGEFSNTVVAHSAPGLLRAALEEQLGLR
jgi:hypothetical protein